MQQRRLGVNFNMNYVIISKRMTDYFQCDLILGPNDYILFVFVFHQHTRNWKHSLR